MEDFEKEHEKMSAHEEMVYDECEKALQSPASTHPTPKKRERGVESQEERYLLFSIEL